MNFKTFDLNLLRVLDALLIERSTVKAGHRIGLSQPAVSAALRRLREATGDPLLIRSGQGMLPTDYAQTIELPLRLFLGELETIFAANQRFDPSRSRDVFKIAGSDFYGEHLMPGLVRRLQSEAPDVRVQLVELVADSHLDSLKQQSVDMALVPRFELPDWVSGRDVFQSDFVVVARKGHPRLSRAGVAPEQVIPLDLFCDIGHVLFSPQGNLRAMGDAALTKVGRERKVVATVTTFSAVWRNVAQSDLIAILPEQLARHVAEEGGLSIYESPIRLDRATISLIWHKRFTGNPAHRWMRDMIADVMAPLNKGYPDLNAS